MFDYQKFDGDSESLSNQNSKIGLLPKQPTDVIKEVLDMSEV